MAGFRRDGHNYLLPESLVYTCARILFLVSLLFGQSCMAEFYSMFPYFSSTIESLQSLLTI